MNFQFGQELCRAHAPPSSYRELYAAIVCSEHLSGARHEMFASLGLLHVLAVSGAQFYVLERALQMFPRPLRLTSLFIYAWLAGFTLPALRALARRGFALIDVGGLSAFQTELAVTLTFAVSHPAWLTRAPFYLGWLAALAARLPWPRTRLPAFNVSSRVAFVLMPLALASPLTLLFNTLFAPLLLFVYFPASALTFLVPKLGPAVDLAWRALVTLLAHLPAIHDGGRAVLDLPLLALYAVGLQIFVLVGECRWRRASAFFV